MADEDALRRNLAPHWMALWAAAEEYVAESCPGDYCGRPWCDALRGALAALNAAAESEVEP